MSSDTNAFFILWFAKILPTNVTKNRVKAKYIPVIEQKALHL
jgi:hypothetical protein